MNQFFLVFVTIFACSFANAQHQRGMNGVLSYKCHMNLGSKINFHESTPLSFQVRSLCHQIKSSFESECIAIIFNKIDERNVVATMLACSKIQTYAAQNCVKSKLETDQDFSVQTIANCENPL